MPNLDKYRALYPRVSIGDLRASIAFHTDMMNEYYARMDADKVTYHNEARLLADAELRKREARSDAEYGRVYE
jgi:hypothetical protein